LLAVAGWLTYLTLRCKRQAGPHDEVA
jgi:hypothetical protein